MPRRIRQLKFGILAVAVCLVHSGCRSASRYHLAAVARFESGTPEDAVVELDQAANKRGAEAEIIAVDRAIAMLMAGDAASCETSLRAARDRMDFLRQKDLREQTTAVLTDDKAVAWAGREFEQRMVDNLLVLSSLIHDRGDSYAYASQVMEHVAADRAQLLPEDSSGQVVAAGHVDQHGSARQAPPPERFMPNALAAYLQATVHSENAMDVEVTDQAIRQVGYWTSATAADTRNAANALPVITAAFGTQTGKGQGTVHVITFAGRVTDWVGETAAPTSAALLIADQILSANSDHSVPPTVAPVQIARPGREFSSHPFTTAVRISSAVPTAEWQASRSLVDLNRAAWDSYQHDRDQQLARAVARRIVKKGAVYAAKDQLAIAGDSGADLLLNLGGMAWEALEKPDTRHVHFLPERVEVLQAVLPVGEHVLEVGAMACHGPTQPRDALGVQAVPIRVDDGRNTFVLCFRPSDQCSDMTIVTSK